MRWGRVILGVALAMLACVALAQSVLDRLVSPGELSKAHSGIMLCVGCHLPFKREAQDAKCLSCHKDIGSDIRTHIGYHGRAPNVRGAQCKSCHGEHHGRDFALIRMPTAFNHALTDFNLHGAHTGLKCAACHLPKKRWRDAPRTCSGCHTADDPHHGSLGRNCASCHSDINWKTIHGFSHHATGFDLIGAHATTACVGCHANNHFANTPTACISCHREDDVHHGDRGMDCASCHTPVSWKAVSFDHGRDTGFPLDGAHRSTSCASCHGANMAVRKPPTTCNSCHKSDDVHHGHNGTVCSNCHTPASWKTIRFDHARLAQFELHAAHASVPCAACHKGPMDQVKPPLTCVGCHGGAGDAHKGALGPNCASCHSELAWKPAMFDHSLTGFPLLGKHASLACSTCHAAKDFAVAGKSCISCHADTVHKGRYGRSPNCANCHGADSWQRWHFDHATTGFRLDGAHAGIACTNCHVTAARNASLKSDCVSCHRKDDVHRGAFGTDCQQCHTLQSFKSATVRRQKAGGRMRQ